MKNLKLFLVGFCSLVIVFAIIWMTISSNFIGLVVNKHLPLPVFWEYTSEPSFFDSAAIDKCKNVENGTTFIVYASASPIETSAYFNANGSLICRTGAHADIVQITEGIKCPNITVSTCENIASIFRG